MRIKTQLLQAYIEKHRLSVDVLANEMGISVTEVEKLLSGEAVGEKTAEMFVDYFGAEEARKFVDWDAIGKKDPDTDEV